MEEVVEIAGEPLFGMLSFRAPQEFIAETRRLAGDLPLTQYLREAVREKNARELVSRISFLSARLASESAEMTEVFDETVGDGL